MPITYLWSTRRSAFVAQGLLRAQVEGLYRMEFELVRDDNCLAICRLSAKILKPSLSGIITIQGLRA